MTCKRILKCTVAAIALTLALPQIHADSPKREFRSSWFTTVWNIDWPSSASSSTSTKQAEIRTYLDNFKKMNFTGTCLQIRGMADAMYKSSYEPWSSALTGTRGKDPGWDPLAYMIEQCHQHGLECYAYVNPFRQSSGTSYTTTYDKQWASQGLLLTYGSYTVFNPGLPAARQHVLNVIREIITNYQIDGMLFDDYFYPNNIPESSSAPDYSLYTSYKNGGGKLSIGDWRRENINSLMREIRAMIDELRPDMRFGIGPAGVAGSYSSAKKYGVPTCTGYSAGGHTVTASDWQYAEIYSEPLAWLSDGSIDFITPQIYWFTTHSTAPYEPIAKWWSEVADKFGRHFYSSHSLSALTDNNTATNRQDYIKQININRQYSTSTTGGGSVWYSSKHFKDISSTTNIGNKIGAESFTSPSLVPVTDWKSGPTYTAPSNAQKSGSTLTWNRVSGAKSNTIIRYTVYAIPATVTYNDALGSDGFDGKYLQGVTYSTSYTLASNKTSGYWYAVCVYDGYGREHEAALIGYNGNALSKATLLSPTGDATAKWSQIFAWSAKDGTNFTVQISPDASFSKIVASATSTSMMATIDLGELAPVTKYYWRVISSETNKVSATSDAATFTTPAYDPAPAVTLIAPNDGAIVEDNITFSWEATGATDSYRLEASTSISFNNITFTKNAGNATSMTISASNFGRGTFYWRIVSSGYHLSETASAIRSFTIEKLSVGTYEPGYTIKQDPEIYSSGDDKLEFVNLWIRSVDSPFENITYENNGSLERAMVALDGKVYVTYRSENSKTADLYLRVYDGETGEHLSDINLWGNGDAQIGYFPLNNVCKDSRGNVVIANMVLNASTSPVALHKVNLATGELTKICEVNTTGSYRIDHASVEGDVTSGTFTVFLPQSNGNTVTRYFFVDGELDHSYTSKIGSYYPSSVSVLGIAPRVWPINSFTAIANGGSIHPTLYTFNGSASTLKSSVGKASSTIVPQSTEANGFTRFQYKGTTYMVYPWNTYDGDNGWQFALTRSDNDMSTGSLVTVFPKKGLGFINSTTMSAPADAEVSADGNTATVYVYATGNGLAAYRLAPKSTSTGIDNIENENISDGPVEYFDLQGRRLSAKPSAPGLYIRRHGSSSSKILIR